MSGQRAPRFGDGVHSLVAQRRVTAEVQRVFEAWTTPELLCKWWGPAGVECTDAEVDLTLGGRYRLANEQSDGSTVWITGVFLEIEKPNMLRYSWTSEPLSDSSYHSEVLVTFEGIGLETEVTVRHERIQSEASRIGHGAGWSGCLDGLRDLLCH